MHTASADECEIEAQKNKNKKFWRPEELFGTREKTPMKEVQEISIESSC